MNNEILETALDYLAAGLSPIPTRKDKKPIIPWKGYQEKLVSETGLRKWFSPQKPAPAIALVTGKVSGNLEVLDFDVDPEPGAPQVFDFFLEALEIEHPGLFQKVVKQNTQSGGIHVVFRCPEIKTPGNQKLAARGIDITYQVLNTLQKIGVDPKDPKAVKKNTRKIKIKIGDKEFQPHQKGNKFYAIVTLIETRGEGGYFLVDPSPGYSLTQGDFTNIPEVSKEERNVLFKCARLFNKWIDPGKVVGHGSGSSGHGKGLLPGEDFNQRGDIRPILEKHGWMPVSTGNGKYHHYRRPGKDRGQSASLIDNKLFFNFSSNAFPFELDKAYTPFSVLAYLDFDGDFSAAAKALAEEGYGDSRVNQQESSIGIDEDKLKRRVQEILDAEHPVPSFDPSPLPPLIYEYIVELCNETSAEPIAITQSVLVTLASIIGKRVCIPEGEYFQRLYPVLWFLTIIASGQFKTTAQRKGSAIAQQNQRECFKEIQELKTEISRTRKNPSLNEETKEKKIKDLEEDINRVWKTNPILPTRSTDAGLLDILADDKEGNEAPGGQIICSEFGELAQHLQKSYNVGFKALLTDLFDSPQSWVYRTKTQGILVIRSPFVCINAMSTLSWVIENVERGDVTGGFFTRWLLFYPPLKESIPPALPMAFNKDYTTQNNIVQVLNSIREPRRYRLEMKASKLFNAIHEHYYYEIRNHPIKTQEVLGSYIKRWSPYILKVAMLLQIFVDPETDFIGVDAIRGAAAVVDYAIKSTVHLFANELGESPQQRKQRLVLQYIAKHEGKVARNKLLGSRVLDGGVTEYDYVLESLEAAGSIAVEKSRKAKTRWKYVLCQEFE